ncbi:MAG: TonB-dependent receptor [Bacteroidota bacterium]|nr:TonB-dependent receptor [Bacteroidota bacterium]
MKKMLLLMSVMLFVSSSFMFAGTTGKLTGKIIDGKTKEPLPFVNVIIVGTNLGAATDVNGNYVILNIPPGNYKVRIQYVGYQTLEMEKVPISVDLTTTRDFEIFESAVQMETIVVQGKLEVIKKDVTSSQSTISADQISALPVAEMNDILQLQAGVTRGADGSFHIRGGRSSEIAYWVNGVSVTDAFDNSRGIDIDNSSVQELQVISGTFNAEYGNAMSGIVNTVTKEGGLEYHGNIKLYASDHLSDFTSYFPHINDYNPLSTYNMQASLSGPIIAKNNMLTFFVSGRYIYDDGYLYGEKRFTTTGQKSTGETVAMNWSKRYMGQANISFAPLQSLKFNLEFLGGKDDWQDYDHSFRLEPDGNVFKFSRSYNTTLTMTHMLSSSTFYTVKGSYFFKDFNEHLYADPYDSRYLHPDSLATIQYAFHKTGTNLHHYFRETNTFVGKLDLTSQLFQNHLIKFGLEGKLHRLQLDDYNLQPAVDANNQQIVPFKPAIPDANTPNRTKYDNKPIEFATYLQDKIEYQNVIINLGLRLDYFNAKAQTVADPSDPNPYIALRPELAALTFDQRLPYYYKDVDAKWALSPRFGIAYPLSDKGVLHFSYGSFLQIPSFQYLYNNGKFLVPESGSNYGVYGNPDLQPQKTIMYELGFRQEFMDIFSMDVTGFYRDVRNWITAGPLNVTRNLVTYSMYINKDYSNVKGITLTLDKRYSDLWSFNVSYTYQVAEGSNSSPEDEFYAQTGNSEPTLYLLPMDWDQRHLLNANLFVGEDSWGASLIARYGTGLPYTPTITQFTSERGLTSGLTRNSRRRPAQFTIDLKLNKMFKVAGLGVNAFVQVFNLLDNHTVVNVWGDTGKADYTTTTQNIGEDSNRPNTVAEYIKYPGNYGEPRNVQLGVEIQF